MRTILLSGVIAAIASPLHAQATGRMMQILAPAVLGQTATFGLTYPAAASGNPYAFLWCMPPFAGAQALSVPGFTVQGLLRVSPASSVTSYTGVLGTGGSLAHSLVIPSDPSFFGMSWDLQSVDLAVSSSVVSLADNDLSLVVSYSPSQNLNLVSIVPGTFPMGSPALSGYPYYNQPEAQPVHSVTITRPFWIGRWEVTQSQYQTVMGSNPSYFQGTPNAASRPVEQVSWLDAVAYCDALTVQEAAAGRLPSGYEYRLPTEAEWEYCCRAGTATEFHYGPSLVCGQANFSYSYHTNITCSGSGGVLTSTVGSYASNAWGLLDMHGNVWEWCLDRWDGSANYPASAVSDPYVTGGSGHLGVLRGGSWVHDSANCRAAFRFGANPGSGNIDIGFRVVCAPVLP